MRLSSKTRQQLETEELSCPACAMVKDAFKHESEDREWVGLQLSR